MKRERQGKELTITGFVTPEEWDNDDNVIAIGISTDDDDYVVELNKLGEELFDFLDEDVEVTGIVRESKDGTKYITVTNYEVLDLDEEGDEDYEDFGYEDEDGPDFEYDRTH